MGILYFAFIYSSLSWSQDGTKTLITESDFVERIPNNCQGFLVMEEGVEGVDSWKVEVFEEEDGVLSLAHTYHSSSGMRYVQLSVDDYTDMSHSIVVSGLDADGNVIVTETHEAMIGDGPTPNLLDCSFTCEGPDYAWRVSVYGLDGSPNESLKIGRGYATPPTPTTAGVYFFENIHSSQVAYFNTEATSRGVSLAANSPHLGVKYMDLTEVQTGQTIFDKYGAPIPAGEFYYRLFKDMGPWEVENGASTGFRIPHPSPSFCLNTTSGIIDVLNDDAGIHIDSLLSCAGAEFTSSGPFVSTGTYTPDLIDCLMDLPVYPTTPDWEIVDGIFLPTILPMYLESALAFEGALDDCYDTYVADGDPDIIMPQIAEIAVIPVDVEGDFTETTKFTREDEDMGTALFSRPDGLYIIGFTLMDGTYILTYQEKSTPDLEEVEDFTFTLSPNPATFGSDFQVTLDTEIEGSAKVEIYDLITGTLVLEGFVSNGSPFVGSIRSGNRSYTVNVYTDTQSDSQGLILE